MPKTPGTRSSALAAAARRENDPVLTAALAVWSSLDDRAQRRLVYEIVEARQHELRLAYPDALFIGHGFRKVGHRGGSKGRRRQGQVTDEPCVIFTVKAKRKLTGKSGAARRRHIPPCLFAHATNASSGRRLLCAVPTDVRALAELKARPHGEQALIERPPVKSQLGYVTCAVTRSDVAGLFALSCHHVFAMSKVTNPPGIPASGATIMLSPTREPIGTLVTDWIGGLSTDPGVLSFDAALCSVQPADLSALRRACGRIQPQRSTDDPAWIPTFCTMTVGDKTVNLKFVAEHFAFNQIRYFERSNVQPIQARVLEFAVESGGAPIKGDSGTAVMTRDGTEFVAMHIAGSRDGTATFALPAYELGEGARYGKAGHHLTFPQNW